jgi:hypothetical protein
MMRTTSNPAICPASLVAWRCESSKYAGTVMTAFVTGEPKNASASRFNFCSTFAEISWGSMSLPSTPITALPSFPLFTSNGIALASFFTSEYRWPMKRLAEKMVRLGLVTAWRLAATPTSTSLSLNATTEGVVRLPSALGMTVGSPPSMTATQELVVPRSIPMILDIRESVN